MQRKGRFWKWPQCPGLVPTFPPLHTQGTRVSGWDTYVWTETEVSGGLTFSQWTAAPSSARARWVCQALGRPARSRPVRGRWARAGGRGTGRPCSAGGAAGGGERAAPGAVAPCEGRRAGLPASTVALRGAGPSLQGAGRVQGSALRTGRVTVALLLGTGTHGQLPQCPRPVHGALREPCDSLRGRSRGHWGGLGSLSLGQGGMWPAGAPHVPVLCTPSLSPCVCPRLLCSVLAGL